MTRLTISDEPGEEFAVRAYNSTVEAEEDVIVFYDDVIKVHVASEHEGFTIQILVPESVIEMDFEDVDQVHDALMQFERKKVLEVDFDVENSVRIMPPRPELTAA